MNTKDYASLISESESELLLAERQQSDTKSRDRIRFIRLLKAGICHTQMEAGECIGLKRTQSQKIWRDYKHGGLSSLVASPSKRGFGKLSAHQISLLRTRLSLHDISSQPQLAHWISQEFGVEYTQAGISLLLKRLKIKLKTGRPSNIRKDEAEEMAFKKTLLS